MANRTTTENLDRKTDYFPFLSLPGELRDQIYRLALQGTPHKPQEYHPHIMSPGSEQFTYASLSSKAKPNFNFLLCNKQIYQETIDLLYKLHRFDLEIINFKVPASLEHWPFWTRIKHLDVHVYVEESGSLSALTKVLAERMGSVRIHRLHLVSSVKGGILDELEGLAGLKVHGPVSIHVDTTDDEHISVKTRLGPILTGMIGNGESEIEVQGYGVFKVDAFSRPCSA
ncbi:hypothetical protein E6O75_ATG01836 [Venturia nashicola]|uniref:DUF7730 domain-containing protein n=1 Tax=Venturia nashicola TaxID=86259 RepID=A0A4Z1PJZ6_9PEZI|nr:hypothetical protein E6O75_ATG01836 [Venturia nashicola]